MGDTKAASRAIPKAPRAYCPTCHLDSPLRSTGLIGEHRLVWPDGRPSTLCDGSGKKRPAALV